VLLFGTDQRITSGPAARTAAFRGRIHGCTRTIRKNVRFFSCTAGAVHTWHECDLRAAPTNVRSWELNGLNVDVVFGPLMTPNRTSLSRLLRAIARSQASATLRLSG
jgi:hypothetical protein